MREITLTINGKQVKGKEGNTILDVCRANEIYVPTLCHLEGLSDVGACRMCVVEIEGERRINPACTYPARDGLVVRTHTENLESYRRMILELLFTERNHLCPFCAVSGECELQTMAYRYQMDHVRYPYSWPSLPVDSVSDYIIIDHNRCILCGRCVIVCDEIVANHTLDFGRRGWRTVVCADLNEPLGESSCISCGACAQACPTGAIFTKPSVYKGKAAECNITRTICSICGIGCETDVLVRDNNLVRIDGAELTGLRGQLCFKGRFEQLYERYSRITTPLLRNGKGGLEKCSWDKALNAIVKKLAGLKEKYGADSIAGIASSQNSNESLRSFKKFIHDIIGSSKLDTIDGDDYRVMIRGIADFGTSVRLGIESPLDEILKADCILVVGAEPLTSHPVAGCYILRAVKRNKARLIILDSWRNAFSYRTYLWLKPRQGTEDITIKGLISLICGKSWGDIGKVKKELVQPLKELDVNQACAQAGVDAENLERVAEAFARAERGVILFGQGMLVQKNPEAITALLNLAAITGNFQNGKARVICLKSRGNSRGAWELGLANPEESVVTQMKEGKVKALYLLSSDDYFEDDELLSQLKKVDFLVVQSSYSSPFTAEADVVLPSVTWAEREGTYVTLDGISKQGRRVLQPPQGIREDWEPLQEISKQLGKDL